jgi:Na+/pantothenate symporter
MNEPVQAGGSNAALITFSLYILVVFALAWLSHRLLRKRKGFLSEYFLGSRNLGMWAFALTFAATSASGGSFTGFPSLIYTHGWILALWIASYMVVPICTMGFLGKRLNQVARKSGAITVPDVVRDRFESASIGLLATLLIVFFMSFNLIAQFKAGSLILSTLLADVPAFKQIVGATATLTASFAPLSSVKPEYFVCLVIFAASVIAYTAYGGFRAVVWTDMLQGVVMIAGVAIMLPLTLYLVGGLPAATQDMARMTPPAFGKATLEVPQSQDEDLIISGGTWFAIPNEMSDNPTYVRTGPATLRIPAGTQMVENVDILLMTYPTSMEQERIAKLMAATPPLAAPVSVHVNERTTYAVGADQAGVYVNGPGPVAEDEEADGFLPLSLAISFFFLWAISGTGQPSAMVRLMAFKDTKTLQRSIVTVSIYFGLIYMSLVVIFCCARVLLPGMEYESDRIMPAMAVHLTQAVGVGWLAGLLVAAPFAAIMSTVDSFLLMISSSLVRDVYQRNINPQASEKRLKRMSYTVTLIVGAGAMLGALNPPQFLQDIIVYTASGLAACFLIPVAMALYWSRSNAPGAVAAMAGGFLVHLSLYVTGYFVYGRFKAFDLFSINPIIWGLMGSLLVGLVVTTLTPPPPRHLVRKYFYEGNTR